MIVGGCSVKKKFLSFFIHKFYIYKRSILKLCFRHSQNDILTNQASCRVSLVLTRMTTSIKAKLPNQKEGQTYNNSCRVSELNKQNIHTKFDAKTRKYRIHLQDLVIGLE